MNKVVVLGGGIGGVETAIALKKEGFNVELISDRESLFVYPISIWIPTGEKDINEVQIPLEEIAKARGFDLTIDRVIEINGKESSFTLEKEGKRTDFDYLVVALGQSKLKHKGIENTLSVCGSPEEILQIKEKIDELVKNKKGKIAFGFGGNPEAPEAVRGGPVFEVMFNVHNYLKKIGIRENFEITFFAPMPKPGARLGEKALKMMDMMFKNMGINKITGKKIKEFTQNSVIFEDDSSIEADLIIFTPAGDGHPVIKNSDLTKTEAGFLKIEDTCQVIGFDNIYAVGDSASIEGPEWRAKQGHLAEVMGRVTAHNIAVKEGKKIEALKGYKEHINIMCLMDTGNGGALAYRSDSKAMLIPLPVVGHWMKKGWGIYYRLYKLGKIPRLI
ncbi:sulfide-quinone oxidoreductase [Persephonella hydrogeniphila]|uniref:4-hydroxybenzoate brominase (decarboxylating) n=1 Tax=Persephonella hydrogeniphila TaxID=198703 RepID=A0A285NM54_9AQUI|nr:FAD-dependent oxidoreductase [Persephonella hydrogeniphila]SNZ10308.1 sulfide-quinone oxidoreductase [Persephonella hydrogeniphila]